MASRRKFRLLSRGALRRLTLFALIAAGVLLYAVPSMTVMPGRSHSGPLPVATPAQLALADALRAHVVALTPKGMTRSTYSPRGMAAAATYIRTRLLDAGYTDIRESFVERGARTPNFEVIVPGASRRQEIIVVGAHYDSFQGTPGADDNASGVAAVLELAARFRAAPRARTVRFLFFVNEEPPAFWTPAMGSYVYAAACRAAGDDVRAMLSIESIGYYDTTPGSQKYPAPLSSLYPDTGDFIGFVSNWGNRGLVRRCVDVFRRTTPFPSEGAALPGALPGVGWSDHWSFWEHDYPALMVTGTATFRNPHYHLITDTAEKLDYERTARVVEGLERVLIDLAEN